MKEGYFLRVAKQTPTQMWINNPSRQEADWAIEAGAVGCTTNPSFCQKMIDHPDEGPYALALLDKAVRETDNETAAEVLLQRWLVKPILERFLPVYDKYSGDKGYVSVQGDPFHDLDPKVIIAEGLENRALGKNACVKVPCTEPGLEAMETLIEEGVPINVTEVFAVAQVLSVFEMHKKASTRAKKRAPVFLSHIAGIYDDYLKQYVQQNKVEMSPDVLWQGGLAVARKVYKVLKDGGYDVTFVGGGARGLHHFTEMVGGDVVVTINWRGTADELIKTDPPVVYRLFNPVEQYVIDELMEKLPDFKRGYLDDGLTVKEYEDFGPLQLFKSSFIKSWKRVLELAKERRAALK